MIDISRQEKALENDYGKSLSPHHYNTQILIVGCGGVGSPLSELLIRGGFTNITLVDFDVVDTTNIQRQNFTQNDIGEPKAQALKKRLLSINPEASISIITQRFESINSFELNYDLVFDGTDSIETRKAIDNYCKKHSIPWIYSGAIQSQSACCLISPDKTFEKVIPKNSINQGCEDGVLSSTTYITASFAYTLFLQYLIGEIKYNFIKIENSTMNIFKANI